MKPFLFSSLFFLSLFAACKKDDTPEPVEQELVTTLQMIATPQAGGAADTFVYKVQNGFGSTQPGSVQIDTVRLSATTTYGVQLRVLNESASPAEDITPEIISERDAHLFFLTVEPSSGAGGLLTITDMSADGQGRPFTQTFNMTTGAAGSGAITVTLLHEPTNKSAGRLADAGGETDLEARYPVVLTP